MLVRLKGSPDMATARTGDETKYLRDIKGSAVKGWSGLFSSCQELFECFLPSFQPFSPCQDAIVRLSAAFVQRYNDLCSNHQN